MDANRDQHGNVVLDADKPLIVVWPGTMMGDNTTQAFADFIKGELGADAQFLEEVTTGPDRTVHGTPIACTGGRIDLLFAINPTTMGGFPTKRLVYGMRWLDDAIACDVSNIYPARLKHYLTKPDEALV